MAANPDFSLSWAGRGWVGCDLTAEMLFFGMVGRACRE